MHCVNPTSDLPLFLVIYVTHSDMAGCGWLKKREQQRQQLNLDRYDTPPPESGSDGEDGTPREKTVYTAGDVTMTVTTAPIELHSDM